MASWGFYLAQTRSAGTMKRIADHEPWSTPATIEDPKALHEIREALEARAPFWIEA